MPMSINRIRLEFKAGDESGDSVRCPVLIESDWNLKDVRTAFYIMNSQVLIESDWNLKGI